MSKNSPWKRRRRPGQQPAQHGRGTRPSARRGSPGRPRRSRPRGGPRRRRRRRRPAGPGASRSMSASCRATEHRVAQRAAGRRRCAPAASGAASPARWPGPGRRSRRRRSSRGRRSRRGRCRPSATRARIVARPPWTPRSSRSKGGNIADPWATVVVIPRSWRARAGRVSRGNTSLGYPAAGDVPGRDLRPGPEPHPVADALDVRLGRALGDVQPCRDLPVGQALG